MHTSSVSSVLPGVFLAVLAALLFSCLNVAIRFSEPYLTVWHMMLGRSLIGTFFLICMARSLGVGLLGQRRGILLLLGCTGTGGIVLLTMALLTIPLFQALILFYTYPAVAALTSPWLTADTNSTRSWACIALAFCGTGLTLWTGQTGHMALGLGHMAGLGASLCMGVTMTLVRRVSAENNPLIPIFYISVLGIGAGLVPLLHPSMSFAVSASGLLGLLAIGLFAVLAHISTNKALGYISSAKVGSIGMLEVVFGALYGYMLFAEPLGWSTVVGGTLVCAAVLGLVHSG